jgi:hypothetical protein
MVSIVRAGVSCLPIVSPFVNYYNGRELVGTIQDVNATIQSAVRDTKPTGLNVLLTALSPEARIEALQKQLQDCENEIQNTGILEVKKNRVYTACSLVGHVLSIALIVGAVALNILPGVLAGVGIFVFSLNIASVIYQINKSYINEANLNQAKRDIARSRQALRTPPTE